jgi:hypothetical protein
MTTSMRRLMPALVLAAAAACHDSSTSPTNTVIGTYALATVNGQALPFQFTLSTGEKLTLNSDLVTLRDDGTYSDIGKWTSSASGNFTVTEVGTYSETNGTITFFDQTDGITYQGTLAGSVLTESSGTMTQVYQKVEL